LTLTRCQFFSTYGVNTLLTKIPASYFMDTDKLILTLYGEAKDLEQLTQYQRRRTKFEH
jgi:hypothetical protein